MQLIALAVAAALAVTTVQAEEMSTLHLRVQSGGMPDWGACTGNLKCQSPTSVCVRYSQWYSQCKPATLPQGELCGQNDGTNVWKYDHCPSGQVCSSVGTDFRCKNKKHHKEHHKAGGPSDVADWGACTGGLKCQNPTSACVYYNQWYSQCTPGASNGVDDWGACTGGLKCKTSTSTCVYYNQWYSQCTPGASSGIDDWGACTGNLKCKTSTSVCVRYSQWYSQCKPATLPQGELCGQNDGTNVWKYDHCPSGQTCKANGSDFRCKNKKHHKEHDKDSSCTITNESQCDGQNWSGSTCCADSTYECRWSDDGQNVKRCQMIVGHVDNVDSGDITSNSDDAVGDDDDDDDDVIDVDGKDDESDVDDESAVDDDSVGDDGSDEVYTTFVDDWGDCTKDGVGCTTDTSVCVEHSQYYSQCKPATLPSGQLCGQDDGTNVWFYDHCPSEETCEANGSDFRCTKA